MLLRDRGRDAPLRSQDDSEDVPRDEEHGAADKATELPPVVLAYSCVLPLHDFPQRLGGHLLQFRMAASFWMLAVLHLEEFSVRAS